MLFDAYRALLPFELYTPSDVMDQDIDVWCGTTFTEDLLFEGKYNVWYTSTSFKSIKAWQKISGVSILGLVNPYPMSFVYDYCMLHIRPTHSNSADRPPALFSLRIPVSLVALEATNGALHPPLETGATWEDCLITPIEIPVSVTKQLLQSEYYYELVYIFEEKILEADGMTLSAPAWHMKLLQGKLLTHQVGEL